jgi:hypothetical protein
VLMTGAVRDDTNRNGFKPCSPALSTSSRSMDAASRQVTAALNSAVGCAADLLTAVDEVSPVWAAELAEVREHARRQQAIILNERTSLRTSLNHGATLLDAISPNSGTTRATLYLASSDVAYTAVVLKNISDTLHLIAFLEAAPKLVADAAEMLERVSEASPGSTGIASDIFHAHENIVACERIRDIALLDVLPNLDDASQVTDIFEGTESARDQLEHYLMANMFADVPRYARADPRALVAAVRIVQREEQEDAWWRQYLSETGLSSAGSLVRPHVRREYERLVHEATIRSIERNFRQVPSSVTSLDDTFAWIKKLVAEEQETRRFVVPCFPASYDIGELFTNQYHKCIMTVLTDLFGSSSLPDEDDSSLLRMVQWYGEYRRSQGSGVGDSGLELSDIQRDRLIAAVERHGRRKVRARVEEILRDDSRSVLQQDLVYAGENDPSLLPNSFESRQNLRNENDEDAGMCTTAAPEMVFSAVGKQIKDARVLRVPAVNTAVARLATSVLRYFQSDMKAALECISRAGSPVPRDNPKYVCAIANNMARCLSYAEELRESVSLDIADGSRTSVEEDFEDLIDGFRLLSSCAVDDLCRGVQEELDTLTKRFFAPGTGTEVMLDVIEILYEFFVRYTVWLLPFHFEQLAVGCLRHVVLQYLKPFLELRSTGGSQLLLDATGAGGHSKSSTGRPVDREHREYDVVADEADVTSSFVQEGLSLMKADAVIAQLDKDVGNLKDFFASKVTIYERKQLEPAMEAVSAIRELFTCSPTSQSLTTAYVHTAGVILRLGGGETLDLSSVKKIWGMRSDVKPSALLEACSALRLHPGGITPNSEFVDNPDVRSSAVEWGARYELMWSARAFDSGFPRLFQ